MTTQDRTFLGTPPPSGVGVPPMGLGLAALGRPGYINLGRAADLDSSRSVEAMREACWKVLDVAYDAGVRYFDAARSYGRAEEFLSGWLQSRGHAPGSVLVGSKWGYYYTADWRVETGGSPHEVKDHTAARLASQQQETDQLLGSHLNLYQIHSATLESGVLKAPDVLKDLEKLKKERGWKIGLSLSGAQQSDTLTQALAIRMSCGQRLFDSVQATWNLLEQSAGDALLEAYQAGLSVIIKEGLANGRLTLRNTDPHFEQRMQTLQAAAARHGCSVDSLALACIIAQPFKPMVLSGAVTVEQLKSNLGALELAPQLDPSEVQQLMQTLRQPAGEYWGQRAQLAWN